MSTEPKLSIIIPAWQEATNIPALLDSLTRNLPPGSFEVIVADNGSTDDTQALARAAGAQLVEDAQANISQLRNLGVAQARAAVLVFLDADIRITPQWGAASDRLVSDLKDQPMTLTGCRGAPDGDSWIERVWFRPLVARPARYLVSSHLITTRTVFDAIGGFDEALDTGEDFDFCQRAIAAGARLEFRPELEVTDTGYPASLRAFARRESWHGLGDAGNVATLLGSSTALASLAFGGLHLLGLTLLLMGKFLLAGGVAASIVAACLLASRAKRRHAPLGQRLQHATLCYVYFGARLASIIRRLVRGTRGRHQRA